MKRDSELYHQLEKDLDEQEYSEFIKGTIIILNKLKDFYKTLDCEDLQNDIAELFDKYQNEALTQCCDSDVNKVLSIKINKESLT